MWYFRTLAVHVTTVDFYSDPPPPTTHPATQSQWYTLLQTCKLYSCEVHGQENASVLVQVYITFASSRAWRMLQFYAGGAGVTGEAKCLWIYFTYLTLALLHTCNPLSTLVMTSLKMMLIFISNSILLIYFQTDFSAELWPFVQKESGFCLIGRHVYFSRKTY